MLQITEKPAAVLRPVQEDRKQHGIMTFRLVERQPGLGLAFDTPNSDDLIFTCEGRDVLCLSPTIAEHASDVTIDAEETPEGPCLTFLVQRG